MEQAEIKDKAWSRRRVDYTGRVFGRLTVVSELKESGPNRRVVCWCSCGEETTPQLNALRSGNTQSCGCLRRERSVAASKARARHGQTMSPTWISWRNMIQRCDDPHTNGYENYGGRGIRICERWRTYENFVADLGERPARMTLERLDSDRDYEPDNCRWASMREQQNNKRNTRYLMIDGTRHTYADAARHYGINVNVLAYRLSAGWPLLNALTQPLREDRRRPPGAASAPSV